MHEESILLIDLAALHLIRAIDKYGEGLRPYLEADQLGHLRTEVIGLRRALLGLQMGPLYEPGWEVPAELLESVPVEEAAAQVASMKRQAGGA